MGFRCCASGGRPLAQPGPCGGLPEQPVGGRVRLSLVRQRRQRGLQAAGTQVGESSAAVAAPGSAPAHTTFLCPNSDIGMALKHSPFGSGSGLFHYERLGCRGDENRLSNCRSRTFVTGDCSHGNEAAVVCAPPEGERDL